MLWREVQSIIPEYGIKHLQDCYRQVKNEIFTSDSDGSRIAPSDTEQEDLKVKVRKHPKADGKIRLVSHRPTHEINTEKIHEHKEKGMQWKEIHAHMPHWALSTLQKAYRERGTRNQPQPLGIREVRKIARLKAAKMKWLDIQTEMPKFSLHQLRRAYAEARKSKLI